MLENNGPDFWRNAIEKEMWNIMVASDIRDNGKVPVGFQVMTCYFVYDVKADMLPHRVTLDTIDDIDDVDIDDKNAHATITGVGMPAPNDNTDDVDIDDEKTVAPDIELPDLVERSNGEEDSDNDINDVDIDNENAHATITGVGTPAQAAEDIFSPNVGSLKGKTVTRPGEQIHGHIEDVPQLIWDRYQSVVLGMDIMFVNAIPFLLTISRGLRFGTLENLDS
jgi:hypothetical protein